MKRVRFHMICTFRYIKYGFALALIPMVRLLFQLDFENFLIALRQDAFILATMVVIALPVWLVTSCSWENGVLEIWHGFLLQHRQRYTADKIAVIEIYRPVYCRLLGASVVTVYFTAATSPRKRKIYLGKKDAQAMFDALMPVQDKPQFTYKVSGFRRVAFILLSTNVFSTILITVFSVRQILSLLGEEAEALREFLFTSIMTVEQLFEVVLPAGAALVAALLLLLALYILVYSFLHTFRFTAERHQDILTERCGLVQHTQRRIRISEISMCDIRTTPFSRLLRHKPVYISAGGYTGNDVPLLLCRGKEDGRIARLLPAYVPPDDTELANTGPKNFIWFVWVPGALFLLFLLLYFSATRVLPGILPALMIPLLLFAGSFAAHVEAYFTEGARSAPRRGIYAQYTRYFTRHFLCVFSRDVALTVKESPMGILDGRATLRIYLPSRLRIRVRGIGRFTARHMRFS